MSGKSKDLQLKPKYNQLQSLLPKQNSQQLLSEELADCRIMTKNLVYVIGLSSSIANKEKLIKKEYFGQYGTIIKIVVNKNKAYNQNCAYGPSYSAYVTFSKPYEASIAILSLDETIIDNHKVRACFGTTKYCSFFSKGVECTNKDCLFLHKVADESDILQRSELTSNKAVFIRQHSLAIKIADVYNAETKRKILSMPKIKTVFPSPDLIYRSIFVIEHDPNYHKDYKNNNDKTYQEEEMKTYPTIVNEMISNHKENIGVIETTSASSKEDASVDDKNEHQLFAPKDVSRFDFIMRENEAEESKNVPSHIQRLFNKKITMHKLVKHLKNHKYIDQILLQQMIPEEVNDDWLQFIHETNKQSQIKHKDDYADDFDMINSFIIDKCIHDDIH